MTRFLALVGLAVALTAPSPTASAQTRLSDRPFAAAASFAPSVSRTMDGASSPVGAYSGGIELASRRVAGALTASTFDGRGPEWAYAAMGAVFLGEGRGGGRTLRALSLTVQRVGLTTQADPVTLLTPAFSVSRLASRSRSVDVVPELSMHATFGAGEAFREVAPQIGASAGVALAFGRGPVRAVLTPAVSAAASPEVGALSAGLRVSMLTGAGQ